MMLFDIKHRFTCDVLFSLECDSLKLCAEAAVTAKANLSGANLSGADLYGANLYGANLYGADLSGAKLSGANLSGAKLSGADLYGANLYGANLYGADLYGANLSCANLSCAKLSGAINLSASAMAQLRICPSEGAFVAWKKLRGDIIARLVIPHDAERINAYSSRKCRASKAVVHALFQNGATYNGAAVDTHTGLLTYSTGAEVVPDSFDPDPTVECSHGIHFFITREEAEAY